MVEDHVWQARAEAMLPLLTAPPPGRLREIYAAIDALPEGLRLPLCLKYLEDLSEKEAAQALGVPVTFAWRRRTALICPILSTMTSAAGTYIRRR